MIKINKFYWDLYQNSPQGGKAITDFQDLFKADSIEQIVDLTIKYDPDYKYNASKETIAGDYQWVLQVLEQESHGYDFSDIMTCRENAERLLDSIEEHYMDYRNIMSMIIPISIFLFQRNPYYFFPYFFLIRYRYLHQILNDYSLEVNEVNKKLNERERTFFYFDLCDAFYEFRSMNKLSPNELCAFLYDMERSSYEAEFKEDYTKYPRVWLLVGGKHGDEINAKTMFWQGSSEIRKGDICVFYENSSTEIAENKSTISGIWVAQSDGRIDPFFYFYESFLIGDEHKLANPIPFKALFDDPRTQSLPHLGAHLCGAGGSELSAELYENGILPIIKEWNEDFDFASLPQLYHPELPQGSVKDRGDMKPEKWVEEYRIKPLLNNMGFVENRDYLQQVYLQLGHDKEEGERVQAGRTDFSLFPYGNKRKGEAKCADILIEAKAPGEMTNPKDIEKTFWQAESYASRQYAHLLIITDGLQFVLYPRTKDGIFRYSEPDSKVQQFSWDELSDKTSESFKKFRATLMAYKKH